MFIIYHKLKKCLRNALSIIAHILDPANVTVGVRVTVQLWQLGNVIIYKGSQSQRMSANIQNYNPSQRQSLSL